MSDDADDRFDERDPIGKGGMSTIVRVHDHLLYRDTAQKLLDARYVDSRRHVRRFVNEARLTGQLEHPNIVPIHDYGSTPSGQPYILMKLVEGDTLEQLVERAGEDRLEPRRLARFVRILVKVCDALAFAHSRGVVHRDLKPANIMVGPFGEVYLMDWGVSRPLPGSAVRHEAGADDDELDLAGTPAFMAPEQVRGEALGPACDLFALGATLYFVLTGTPPYPGPSPIQALSQALECAWTPLEATLGDRTPAGLDGIVSRCMAASPEDRFPDAGALQEALEEWLRGRWHLPTRTYAPGQIVVHEGDEAAEAFLILDGRCEARTERDGAVVTLSAMGPGQVFGETAIFGQTRRTSTVVATSSLRVQVVTRAALTAASGLDSWVGVFVSAATSRFLDAEARIRQLEEELSRRNTQRDGADRDSDQA